MRKICELGRSMVEMLGVLAIIGVLSVGGIAGYSNAMFKYKLNKQAEQVNQVINSISTHFNRFKHYMLTQTNKNLTQYFIAMGEIPDEMIKNDNSKIYDVFNTGFEIMVEGNGIRIVLYVYLELTKDSVENSKKCLNIITVAKENSANISLLETYSTAEDGHTSYTALYGDKRCSGSRCLKNFSLDEAYLLCTKNAETKDSRMKIHWNF